MCMLPCRFALVKAPVIFMTNQPISVLNVLGGKWDPTDNKFSSVNSHRQVLLPTCKAFPEDYVLSYKMACYHVDPKLLMTHMYCGS